MEISYLVESKGASNSNKLKYVNGIRHVQLRPKSMCDVEPGSKTCIDVW